MSNNKDINNLKGFNDWFNENFTWADNTVKKYMRKVWCARGKYDRTKVREIK